MVANMIFLFKEAWENTAPQCRLELLQDPDFAGDLEDSKSTLGETLCTFGKPYTCSCQLDVQEADMCVTQFNGISDYLS